MSSINNFHYQVIGEKSGSKMVFLHGVMGFGANWKSFANNFVDNFEILVFDQRGHGRSFKPETGFSPLDYANDLKNITESLGWSKIVLIGHSMGGRNAVKFAEICPEKVQALVVVDIGPISDLLAMEHIIEMLECIPTPFSSRDEARNFFDNQFIKKYPNQLIKQFLYANLYEKSEGFFDWRFDKKAILETLKISRSLDMWNEFKSLQMPTLLIRGEKSSDLSNDLYVQTLAKNSNIEGVVIPQAGHWVHVEAPRDTARAISQFLSRHDIVS